LEAGKGTASVGAGVLSLSFLQCKHASPSRTLSFPRAPSRAARRNYAWYRKVVDNPRTGTLVLNRGAHYEDTPTVLASVSAVLDALRRDRPDILVVWRDTPAG
jgi:hypothetical protein